MSSENNDARAQAPLVERALIAVLGLLALGGAVWGINAYNTYRVNNALWTMPVDSYTVVENWGDRVIASYSTSEPGYATRLRQTINSDPDASASFLFASGPDGQPGCNGRFPLPPDHFPPDGTEFTMTFSSGGRVIETVTGHTKLVKVIGVWWPGRLGSRRINSRLRASATKSACAD
jgi:hypothetical protein